MVGLVGIESLSAQLSYLAGCKIELCQIRADALEAKYKAKYPLESPKQWLARYNTAFIQDSTNPKAFYRSQEAEDLNAKRAGDEEIKAAAKAAAAKDAKAAAEAKAAAKALEAAEATASALAAAAKLKSEKALALKALAKAKEEQQKVELEELEELEKCIKANADAALKQQKDEKNMALSLEILKYSDALLLHSALPTFASTSTSVSPENHTKPTADESLVFMAQSIVGHEVLGTNVLLRYCAWAKTADIPEFASLVSRIKSGSIIYKDCSEKTHALLLVGRAVQDIIIGVFRIRAIFSPVRFSFAFLSC